jgi:hypothetical protein
VPVQRCHAFISFVTSILEPGDVQRPQRLPLQQLQSVAKMLGVNVLLFFAMRDNTYADVLLLPLFNLCPQGDFRAKSFAITQCRSNAVIGKVKKESSHANMNAFLM